jgi:hypothetical protein
MSTDYGYRCKQDGAVSETWFQNGEWLLRSIVKLWPAIKQIREQNASGGYLEVSIMGYSHCEYEVWEFLEQHEGHVLEIQDEYGRVTQLEATE